MLSFQPKYKIQMNYTQVYQLPVCIILSILRTLNIVCDTRSLRL